MKAAPMISLSRKSRPHPDAALLKRIGQTVRARLDADPAAYRLPVEGLKYMEFPTSFPKRNASA
jgi:prolyl 4-hydroxylase